MTFVDTHCHLYDEAFDTDRDNAVQRALDAGVTTMLLPDIDSSSSPALDALYNTHPQHFRRMAGLHPTSVKEDYGDELQHVHDRLYSSPKLGEGDRRGAVVEEYVRIMFSPCAEGERASGDDEVYVYAYCPEMEQGVLSAPAYRRMGSVQLTLPERWQGKEVHLYGFAVDYEGNASATVYIGVMESEEVSDGWHNICRDDYVINEKQSQIWQIRKNSSKTSSSTSTPTWPREPTATSLLSATIPPR